MIPLNTKFIHSIFSWLLICSLTLLAENNASAESCSQHFFRGEQPTSLAETTPRLTILCYREFALAYDPRPHEASWSAEHLTRDEVASARTITRHNNFHEEPRLVDGPFLHDYMHSGYDRGHLTPSGDMPTMEDQNESFTLANMIPQAPENNRRVWADIEHAVRQLTMRDKELFIVTGPLFISANTNSLNHRIAIPTHIFKAIYDPQHGSAAAYVAPNDSSQAWKVVNIAVIEQASGLTIFPALSKQAKQATLALPAPHPHINIVDAATKLAPFILHSKRSFANTFANKLLRLPKQQSAQ